MSAEANLDTKTDPRPAPGDGPPSTAIVLHPYQVDAIEGNGRHPGIRRALATKPTALVVMPTGTGKTITFGAWTREAVGRGERILILAHRGELLLQAQDDLARLGVDAFIEKSRLHARSQASLFGGPPSVVLGSVASLKGDRLLSWPRDTFDGIIIDEAHHATAESYQTIFRHFPGAWRLGFTATADRLDGEPLGFATLAYNYPILGAIDDGWLVPLRFEQLATDVDLKAIRTTGGDLNAGDLEDAISPHIEQLVNAARPLIGRRPTMVFTPDIGSADAFAQGLSALGIEAEYIHGLDPRRDEKVAGFRAGKYQVLCNCALLCEGFNAREVECVVLARPTRSRSLYVQMVGRGTRTCPERGKAECVVVDYAWQSSTHPLAGPISLHDPGQLDPEVATIAATLLREGRARGPREAVEKATGARRLERLRVAVREREVRCRRRTWEVGSAKGVKEALGIKYAPEPPWFARPATDRQVGALDRFGIPGAESLSRSQASRFLEALQSRESRQLASYRQVASLLNRGVGEDEARRLGRREASELLEIIGD